MQPSKTSSVKPKDSESWQFEALGTHWAVDMLHLKRLPFDGRNHDDEQALSNSIEQRIKARLDEFEAAYSRFRPDSIVARIAQAAGSFELPADARRMLELYGEMYAATDGTVTPLIGKVLADAGYDSSYSLRPQRAITPPKPWPQVAQFITPVLRTAEPLQLDFGAAGKGYAVDLVAELLEEAGVYEYCVDAGGDMRHRSQHDALRVGLEHPENPGQVIGVARLANMSLCGSAGNRRTWADFTHIIDPHTGRSPCDIKAVWTMAASTLVADGMATCLFFASPQKLQQAFDFEYVIVYDDNSASVSEGFAGELF